MCALNGGTAEHNSAVTVERQFGGKHGVRLRIVRIVVIVEDRKVRTGMFAILMLGLVGPA
jgi:hypothetical protein